MVGKNEGLRLDGLAVDDDGFFGATLTGEIAFVERVERNDGGAVNENRQSVRPGFEKTVERESEMSVKIRHGFVEGRFGRVLFHSVHMGPKDDRPALLPGEVLVV